MIGFFLASLNLFIHEASHYNIHHNKKINDLLANLFVGVWFGLNVKSYRLIHWRHHEKLGTTEDTEHSYFNNPNWKFILSTLLGIHLVKVLLSRNEKMTAQNQSLAENKKLDRIVLVVGMLMNLSLLAIAYFTENYFEQLLIIYALNPITIWLNLKSKVRDLINNYVNRNDATRISRLGEDELIDNDYTKKFRILYNLGQCLNLTITYAAPFLLERSQKCLPPTDYLNNAWVYIEMASASSDDKRTYYDNALDLQNRGYLSPLCSTLVLFNYANYVYSLGNECGYSSAILRYLELEEILDKNNLGFESLKMCNYYQICQTWLKLNSTDLASCQNKLIGKNMLTYLEKCELICRTLKLDFYKSRINNLRISMNG